MDRDLKANLDAIKYYQQNPNGVVIPSFNSNSSGGGDISSVLTSVGTSMSAHPVLAVIGAVLVGAVIAYSVSKEKRKV